METYGPEDFTAQLTDGAATVLQLIGAGVVAGLVIFVVFFGIRAGFTALRTVAEDGPGSYGSTESTYWDAHEWATEQGFSEEKADEFASGQVQLEKDTGLRFRDSAEYR